MADKRSQSRNWEATWSPPSPGIAARHFEPGSVGRSLSFTSSVAGDREGNTYFATPTLNSVYRVRPTGALSRLAGTGASGFAGDGGPAVEAKLASPYGVAVDGSGNVYIADTNNSRIRKVAADGKITTLAGTGCCGYSGDGGPAAGAQLSNPFAVALDGAGNVFVADSSNQRIRRIGVDGIISTVAGNGSSGFSGDSGPATGAQFLWPYGLTVDGSGNLYISIHPITAFER